MITLVGIKNCDSVKKAQKFLNLHQIPFEFIDFRTQPIEKKTLEKWVKILGWDALINKRSTTYRNLSAAEKANITLDLTLKNPTLIKRPVLIFGDEIWVGFDEKRYLTLG